MANSLGVGSGDWLDPMSWLHETLQAESLQEIRTIVSRQLSQLIDVNSLLLVSGLNVDVASRDRSATGFEESAGVLINREWTEFLGAGNVIDDPMTRRLFRTHATLFWWEGSPLHRSMNDVERRFAEHYFEHDIRLGIVDGVVEPGTGRVDMLALDSRVSLSEFRSFQKAHGERLRLAVCWLWEAYRLKALRKTVDRHVLTKRQVECLSWVSCGMRSHDIAERLKLSTDTVNEYIATASRRLGARNRAQACARAVLLGLVSP